MKLIPLSRGMFTKVDDEDFDWLIQFNWHVVTGYNTCYAGRWTTRGNKRVSIKMHREILGLDGSEPLVDHDDGDGLNNQRYNLLISNKQLNALNSDRVRNATGIYYDKARNRWKAFLLQPKHYVGTFKTREEAEEALDKRRAA